MIVKELCVVGDRFHAFAKHQNVVTLRQLHDVIEGLYHDHQNYRTIVYSIHVGQGLSDAQFENLRHKVNQYGLANLVSFFGKRPQLTRACMLSTHKHHKHNVMISCPEKNDEQHYTAYLMLDEQSALMRDHMTGEHIQGMVVMEAMRQMVTATAENYLLSQSHRGDFQFIFDAVDTQFHQFLFPLDATLNLELKQFRQTYDGNCRATMDVEIKQGNKKIMCVSIAFSVINKAYMHDKEASMAQTMIQDVIQIGRSTMEPMPALKVA